MHRNRLRKMRNLMRTKDLDGFIVSKPENQIYISGFSGEGITVITSDKAAVITDFRYTEQAKEESPDFEIIECPSNISPFEISGRILNSSNTIAVGVESHHINVKKYDEMAAYFDSAALALVKTDEMVEEIRTIKDVHELMLMKNAQRITDETFSYILGFIKPGVSEKMLANEMEHFIKKKGADGIAFDTIVASGPRSSLPHGAPTERKISYGDFITLDFGARFQNYCSDMTRTVVLGKPNQRQLEIYDLVLEAQKSALNYIKSNLLGKDVDKVARDIITSAGYGDNFGHGLGHAVGIEIHENPRLSPKGTTPLLPGNVVTVEPGIYIEGFGGVRIEDMVIVTEDGCENLTSSPKELICL